MNNAPWGLICLVFAFVLFALSAFLWPPAVEPYRVRLIGAGLMFFTLASLCTASTITTNNASAATDTTGTATYSVFNTVKYQGAGSLLGLTPTHFANLPTCSSTYLGDMAIVDNSSVNSWGGTADGAGAFRVVVWCNNSNVWAVMGD